MFRFTHLSSFIFLQVFNERSWVLGTGATDESLSSRNLHSSGDRVMVVETMNTWQRIEKERSGRFQETCLLR